MGDTPRPGLGEQLRRLRTRAGLSQEALAERAGLTVKGISALDRGERQHPYPHTFRALVAALQLSEAEEQELLAAIPRRKMPAVSEQREPAAANLRQAPPRPQRPLIGRDADVVAVGRLLLQAPGRLLTLTGPGGVGKTSLALAVASEVAAQFADGATVVDLSPLDDATLVVPAIAAALDIRSAGGEPTRETLYRALCESHRLVVLDNVEHVLAAAPELAALLDACPRVFIFATSRAPLRLRDEQLFPLAPLGLPAPDAEAAAEIVARSPAVQLFLRAAQQAAPDFALNDANAATLAAICRRLDGLPLAIELAAARVRLLGVASLLARLDHALQLLVGGARDLPARQQTMRGTIGWSYTLLEPAEQARFRRLAVFAGSWTLDAAEAVARDLDSNALDGLTALVDHALVVVEPIGSDVRYRLLETVHAFAAERLREADEEAARERHCAYYAEMLGAHREGLLSGPMYEHWQTLAPDLDNIRAAWAWAVRQRRHQELAQMGQGVQTIAEVRGLFGESVVRFREAVEALREAARGGDDPAIVWSLGQLLSLYGIRLARDGQMADAEARLREGLSLLEAREDLLVRAGTLAWLAYVVSLRGGYAEARRLFSRSMDLADAYGDRFFLAFSATHLALVAVLEGADDALALAEAGLAQWRASPHPRGTSSGLWVLSCAQLARGDLAGAEASAGASRAASEAVQDRWGTGRAVLQLGLVALARGDNPAARVRLEESLSLAHELREPWLQGRALVALGALAQSAGRPAEARARFDEALEIGQLASLAPLTLSAQCGLAELLAADDAAAADALLAAIIADPAAEHTTRERARALVQRTNARSHIPV
jgi:predicted ATPase/transcriptional regulator with XRE-family HTH domain